MAFTAPAEDLELAKVEGTDKFVAPEADVAAGVEELVNDDSFDAATYALENPEKQDWAKEIQWKKDQRPFTAERALKLPGIAGEAAVGVVKDFYGGAGAVASDLERQLAGETEGDVERARTQQMSRAQLAEANAGHFLGKLFGEDSLIGRKVLFPIGEGLANIAGTDEEKAAIAARKEENKDPRKVFDREWEKKLSFLAKTKQLEAGKVQPDGILGTAVSLAGGVEAPEQFTPPAELEAMGADVDSESIRQGAVPLDPTNLIPLNVPGAGKAAGAMLRGAGGALKAPAAVAGAVAPSMVKKGLKFGLGASLPAAAYYRPEDTAKAVAALGALVGAKKLGGLIGNAGKKLTDPKFVTATERKAAEAAMRGESMFLGKAANAADAERMAMRTIGGAATGVAGMLPLTLGTDNPEEAAALIGGGAGFGAMAGASSYNPRTGFRPDTIHSVDTLLREEGAKKRYGNDLDARHEEWMKAAPEWVRDGVNAYRGFFNGFKLPGGKEPEIYVLPSAEFAKEAVKLRPDLSPDQAAQQRGVATKDGRILVNGDFNGEAANILGHEAGGHVAETIMQLLAPRMAEGMRNTARRGLIKNGKPTPKLRKFVDAYNKAFDPTGKKKEIQDTDKAITEWLAENARAVLEGKGPAKYAAGESVREKLTDNLSDYFREAFGSDRAFAREEIPTISREYRQLLYELGRLRNRGIEPEAAPEPTPEPEAARPEAAAPEPTPEPQAAPVDPFEQRVANAGLDITAVDAARDRHIGDPDEVAPIRGKKGVPGKSREAIVAEKEAEWDAMMESFLAKLEETGAEAPTNPRELQQAVIANWLQSAPDAVKSGEFPQEGYTAQGPLAGIEPVKTPETGELGLLEPANEALRTNEPIEILPESRAPGTEDAPLADFPAVAPEQRPSIVPETDQIAEAREKHPSGPVREAIDIADANRGRVVWVKDYSSAPKEQEGFSEAERTGEIRKVSAKKRKAGAPGEAQDKPFIVTEIRVNKNGEPYINGFDVDVMLSNLRHIMDGAQERGIELPIKTDAEIEAALETYNYNHANGFDGAGLKRLKQPGPGYRMPAANPDAAPRPLHSDPAVARRIADMLNMAVNSKVKEVGGEEAGKAVAMNLENQGFREGTEVNQLRKELTDAGFDVDANLSKRSAFYGRLSADLIKGGIKTSAEGLAGKSVRPHGFDLDLNKAFAAGKPQFEAVASGFLPGRGSGEELTGKATRSKGLPDAFARSSQYLGNLTASEAFKEKGLGGFDVPTQRAMVDAMLRLAHNPEVLDSVVGLFPVDVVDTLERLQLSPEMPLHDDAVLQELLPLNPKLPVSVPVDVANRLASEIASAAAKVPVESGLSSSGLSGMVPIGPEEPPLASVANKNRHKSTITDSGLESIEPSSIKSKSPVFMPGGVSLKKIKEWAEHYSGYVYDYRKGDIDSEALENQGSNAHEELVKAGLSEKDATQLLSDISGGMPLEAAVEDAAKALSSKGNFMPGDMQPIDIEAKVESLEPERARMEDLRRKAKAIDANSDATDQEVSNAADWSEEASSIQERLNDAADRVQPNFMPGSELATFGEESDKLGFYSALRRVVEQKIPNRVSAEQALATLDPAKAGVKKDEIEWIGLPEWLKEKGTVTKQELLDFIDANGIRLDEVTKGGAEGRYYMTDEWDDTSYAFDDHAGAWILDAQDNGNANGESKSLAAIFQKEEDGSFEIWDVRKGNNYEVETVDTFEEAKRRGSELVGKWLREMNREASEDPDSEGGDTKFSGYKLEGGKNYKEILMTLPVKTSPKANEAISLGYEMQRLNHSEPGSEAKAEEIRKQRDELLRQAREEEGVPFTQSHWDEPNVIAHIRQQDFERITYSATDRARIEKKILEAIPEAKSAGSLGSGAPGVAVKKGLITPLEAAQYSHTRRFTSGVDQAGATEKVRHIDEWQSDWHQQGREIGYNTPEERARLEERKKRTPEVEGRLAELRDEYLGKSGKSLREYEGILANDAYRDVPEYQALRDELDTLPGPHDKPKGVPDAPFKKNWHELAFKRALKLAIEDGMDRMSWSTGQQNADHYDLTKYISEIGSAKTLEGKYAIRAFDHNHRTVIDDVVTAENLPDVVGKEMAQRIIEGTPEGPVEGQAYPGKFTGLDLTVGNEGMKGFYDKIIPDFARKYVKKWNSTVEDITLPNGEEVHSVKITPEMRESVGKGQPQFMPGGKVEDMEPAEIKWKHGKRAINAGDEVVNVNVTVFDKAFAKDQDYIGPKDEGMTGRRKGFEDFIGKGNEADMAEVAVNDEGVATFINGRHRYSVARERGAEVIPVSMSPESAARARAKGIAFMPGGENLEGMKPEKEAGTSNLTAPVKKNANDALMMNGNDPAKAAVWLDNYAAKASNPEVAANFKAAADYLRESASSI